MRFVHMDQTYHCSECDVDFPDKQIAAEQRNGTGHILSVTTNEK
jgi:hypothetical protein